MCACVCFEFKPERKRILRRTVLTGRGRRPRAASGGSDLLPQPIAASTRPGPPQPIGARRRARTRCGGSESSRLHRKLSLSLTVTVSQSESQSQPRNSAYTYRVRVIVTENSLNLTIASGNETMLLSDFLGGRSWKGGCPCPPPFTKKKKEGHHEGHSCAVLVAHFSFLILLALKKNTTTHSFVENAKHGQNW